MTFFRTVLVLIVALFIVDVYFNHGQLTNAAKYESNQFVYWVNRELSDITRKISPFR
jgi:hypothetical protein